jgi:hypothetical protein
MKGCKYMPWSQATLSAIGRQSTPPLPRALNVLLDIFPVGLNTRRPERTNMLSVDSAPRPHPRQGKCCDSMRVRAQQTTSYHRLR